MNRPALFSRLGLRFQLVAFFLAVFGGLFALFSIGMYLYIGDIQRADFDAALYNYVVDVSHSLPADVVAGRPAARDLTSNSEMLFPFSLGETLLQITTEDGKVIARSRNLFDQTLPPADRAQSHHLRTDGVFGHVELRDTPYRLLSHAFRRPGVGAYVIQAAVPMAMLGRQKERLVFFLAVAVPIILLAAGVAGLVFSRRAMAPVGAIISKATEIEARHLSERIPVPECRDEIRQLAETLNGLLDRMEHAFRSQEALVSDVSHQLKTPLSILKGELEVFSQRDRSAAELDDFLRSAKQEVDYLASMVEDLVFLANAESQDRGSTRSRFRVDEKLMECVERMSRRAESRRIALSVDLAPSDCDDGFELVGEPEMMRALMENLLDNAIKYSHPDGTIWLSLKEGDDAFVLGVRDEGTGIPAAAVGKIFDRFYRAEHTRHYATGSGLGLAIVKRVAELHGGALHVESTLGHGTYFQVEFPKRTSTAV